MTASHRDTWDVPEHILICGSCAKGKYLDEEGLEGDCDTHPVPGVQTYSYRNRVVPGRHSNVDSCFMCGSYGMQTVLDVMRRM
jgi:hypothetical protein